MWGSSVTRTKEEKNIQGSDLATEWDIGITTESGDNIILELIYSIREKENILNTTRTNAN